MTVPHRGSKGNAVRVMLPEAVAAPATVSGASSTANHWDLKVPGREWRRVGREPGDLPSVVVRRGHVGRGVLTRVEPNVRVAVW